MIGIQKAGFFFLLHILCNKTKYKRGKIMIVSDYMSSMITCVLSLIDPTKKDISFVI